MDSNRRDALDTEKLPLFPKEAEDDRRPDSSRDVNSYRVWPPNAIVATFVFVMAVGIAITIIVGRSIPRQVPHPAEAYEGVADAFEGLIRFCFGVGLSFLAAFLCAVVAGVWASGPSRFKANVGSDES